VNIYKTRWCYQASTKKILELDPDLDWI